MKKKKKGKYYYNPKYMKTINGYPVWKKSFDGIKKRVHRTRAKKYLYERDREKYPFNFSDYEVHHIDGDKFNFDTDNLLVVLREDHTKIEASREI